MSSTPFKWGIIGPGKIARAFAQDLQLIPNAVLHTVVSRSQERAQAFAQIHGGQVGVAEDQAMAALSEVDAVYIATPHHRHAEWSIRCLEAGIPVLCEKPATLNSTELEQVLAAAKQHACFYMEALWTRFLPTFQQVSEWIAAGAIGEVQSVKADFGFKVQASPNSRLLDPKQGGGGLLDIGIYPLFLAHQLMGSPDALHAITANGPTGVDMEGGILLSYQGGQQAHLHYSFRHHTRTEAHIYGSTGSILMHHRWHEPCDLTLLRDGQPPERIPIVRTGNGYQYETEAAMRAIRAGQLECAEWSWQDSRALMGLLDKAALKNGA